MKIFGIDKERRLLKMFDSGDAAAMDTLYAEYAGYLTGVAYRYVGNDDDLKDVLQESFIKIFTQIGRFQYRGKGSLKAWLTRVVVNESLMYLRRSAQTLEVSIRIEPPDMADDPPDESLPDADTLASMIARLPAGYRTVFNLYAIEGLSHKQIAHQLAITPGTSASQYHKARMLLGRMIKKYKDEGREL